MKALKNILVTSLSVTLFAILMTIMVDVYQWWALSSYSPTATEEVIDEGTLISIGVFSLITIVFMFLMLLLTTVLYFIWLYQLFKRARLVYSRNTLYHPGWAIGYHFIPVLNWIMPASIMWRLNKEQVKRLNVSSLHLGVIIWWGLILLSGFITLTFSLNLDGEAAMTVGDMRFDAIIRAISDLVRIISGAALLVLIQILTKRLFMSEDAEKQETFVAEQ